MERCNLRTYKKTFDEFIKWIRKFITNWVHCRREYEIHRIEIIWQRCYDQTNPKYKSFEIRILSKSLFVKSTSRYWRFSKRAGKIKLTWFQIQFFTWLDHLMGSLMDRMWISNASKFGWLCHKTRTHFKTSFFLLVFRYRCTFDVQYIY